MFTSLRSRLLASYIVMVVVTLLAAALTLTLVLRAISDNVSRTRLRSSLPLTTRLVRELLAQGRTPEEIVAVLRDNSNNRPPFRVLLIDRGTVVGDTEEGLVGERIPRELLAPPQVQGQARYIYTARNGKEYIFAVSLAVVPPARTGTGAPRRLIVAEVVPRRSITVYAELIPPLTWAAAVALFVGLLLAWLISRSVARPLAAITAATERIAGGDMEVNLPRGGPREVTLLAERFQRMVEEVKASRQAQRDFIANVSHDLKTPLTSIRGFSQAILEGVADDPERTQRSAQIIHDEALRLSRLVEQLLDLARLDAGQTRMVFAPVDMAALLKRVCERMRPLALEKDITLSCVAEEGIWLEGDGDRLMQVFGNLIDNAIRHTPQDGEVRCTLQRSADVPGTVEVAVSDTGSGIPPEDLPHVFERFYQVDKSRRRRNSGLGLAIVQEIVQAHGGQVGVESELGRGSRFWVRLPLSQGSRAAGR
ncbi:MAG: sensor histidine kinase [Caldilineae bacterium]|nr:MAG: sensor histidine kinase [Caldilineae bacterium]